MKACCSGTGPSGDPICGVQFQGRGQLLAAKMIFLAEGGTWRERESSAVLQARNAH